MSLFLSSMLLEQSKHHVPSMAAIRTPFLQSDKQLQLLRVYVKMIF